MVKICISVLTVLLFSCTSNNNANKNISKRADLAQNNNAPIKELFIDNGDEEGWGADIRISITNILKTDSSITYLMNSLYENKNIGFNITIPSDLPKSGQNLAQVMTLQSSGDISDNFIRTLAKLYKEKIDTTLKFIPSIKISFIDLDEFAKSQFGKEPVNKSETKTMKVFFESENPDDNAELYININEKEHWIEIKEKDEGYRKPILKDLTIK